MSKFNYRGATQGDVLLVQYLLKLAPRARINEAFIYAYCSEMCAGAAARRNNPDNNKETVGEASENSVAPTKTSNPARTEPTLRTVNATCADFKHTLASVYVAMACGFAPVWVKFQSRTVAGEPSQEQQQPLKPSTNRTEPNRTPAYLFIVLLVSPL